MDTDGGQVRAGNFVDGLPRYTPRNVIRVLTQPPVIFLLLALGIMGPLLLPGRILAIDSPLALNWDIAGYFWGTSDGPESVFAATYNSASIAAVLGGFDFFLPYWLVEKIWLILLFWLCGFGASRLPYLHGMGRYYAGMFYALNPFTYSRFVTGQWGILGAYALIPFAVTAFIRMLEEPRPRHAVQTAIVLTVIGFLQIHGLALALIVIAVLYVCRSAVVRGTFWNSVPMMALSAVLFLGMNLFWMIRYATAEGGITRNMPVAELSHFAAAPLLDVVSLRGFWLSGGYTDITGLVPVWWLLFFLVLLAAIYGAS